jgi:hypothetical protein
MKILMKKEMKRFLFGKMIDWGFILEPTCVISD